MQGDSAILKEQVRLYMKAQQIIYTIAVMLIATAFSLWMYFNINKPPRTPLFVAPMASGLAALLGSSVYRKHNKFPILSGLAIGLAASWMMFSFGTLSGLLAMGSPGPPTLSFSEVIAALEISFLYAPLFLSMSVGFLPIVLILFASLVFTTLNADGGSISPSS